VTYALDNGWTRARARLALLEQCLDEVTQQRFQSLGVGPGARCLEVGAGLGSSVRLLRDRVGPHGHVVATDLDVRFLRQMTDSNVEVWEHDVQADELPESSFDLIHVRWLFYHLPEPDRAVSNLLRALRPGGVLLVEDVDFFPLAAASSSSFVAFMEALAAEVGAAAGHDGHWAARQVPRLLAAHGAGPVHIDARVDILRGGNPMARFWWLTADQMSERLIGGGRLTQAQFDCGMALLEAPEFWSYSTANVAASVRVK
jgi:SAM-dependent methyltransferase